MNEIERIETFTSSNWKDSLILGMKLAKTGFYFCGSNILKCTFCKCILLWNSKEYQEFIHKPQLIHIRLSPTCEYAYSSLPVYANSQYRYFKTRLDSFIGNWDSFTKPTPIALAEAGFFYAGMPDRTKCFYCDGGLNDWDPNDDPWEQHAIHFDRCVFLLYKKGPLYVESIKKRILDQQLDQDASCRETSSEPVPSSSECNTSLKKDCFSKEERTEGDEEEEEEEEEEYEDDSNVYSNRATIDSSTPVVIQDSDEGDDYDDTNKDADSVDRDVPNTSDASTNTSITINSNLPLKRMIRRLENTEIGMRARPPTPDYSARRQIVYVDETLDADADSLITIEDSPIISSGNLVNPNNCLTNLDCSEKVIYINNRGPLDCSVYFEEGCAEPRSDFKTVQIIITSEEKSCPNCTPPSFKTTNIGCQTDTNGGNSSSLSSLASIDSESSSSSSYRFYTRIDSLTGVISNSINKSIERAAFLSFSNSSERIPPPYYKHPPRYSSPKFLTVDASTNTESGILLQEVPHAKPIQTQI